MVSAQRAGGPGGGNALAPAAMARILASPKSADSSELGTLRLESDGSEGFQETLKAQSEVDFITLRPLRGPRGL